MIKYKFNTIFIEKFLLKNRSEESIMDESHYYCLCGVHVLVLSILFHKFEHIIAKIVCIREMVEIQNYRSLILGIPNAHWFWVRSTSILHIQI